MLNSVYLLIAMFSLLLGPFVHSFGLFLGSVVNIFVCINFLYPYIITVVFIYYFVRLVVISYVCILVVVVCLVRSLINLLFIKSLIMWFVCME